MLFPIQLARGESVCRLLSDSALAFEVHLCVCCFLLLCTKQNANWNLLNKKTSMFSLTPDLKLKKYITSFKREIFWQNFHSLLITTSATAAS